jgi:RHS repeat-associated protein
MKHYLFKSAVASLVLISLSIKADQTVSYSYNDQGLIASIDGPRTDVEDITTFSYDEQGNRSQVINALGHINKITAYDLSGRPLILIDPNGAETELQYDARGRLVSQTTEGRTTNFSYDPVGNITQITQANGQVLTYHYDEAHRPIGYSDALGNKVSYILDNAGNKTEENITDPESLLTRTHQFIYDELSRLITDTGGELQSASFQYDTNSNLTAQTDPNGNKTNFAFDGLNRLINTTTADNGQTKYQYDARDNLTAVTDPNGHTTNYSYDGFDNLIKQTSPDTGVTSYSYDEANNRLSQTDARNVTVTYAYDALNRLISVSYPDTTLNIDYHYDENDDGQNGIGRLTSQTDASGLTKYRYDKRGNLLSLSSQRSDLSLTIGYTYNTTDQRIKMSYPDGRVFDYQYDVTGRIDQITTTDSQGTSQTVLTDIQYQPFGPISSQTFGNGLTLSQANDLDYRKTQIETPNILERSYAFDANSNITEITNIISSKEQTFAYDSLDRLIEASGLYGEIDYSYDATHNRTKKTQLLNGLSEEQYQYDQNNNKLTKLIANNTQTFSYDAVGNMTDNGNYQFSYGDDNRLHSINQNAQLIASYRYNAQGQRISKTVSGKTIHYLYDINGQLIAEINNQQQSQLPQLLQQAQTLEQSIASDESQLQQHQKTEQTQQQTIQNLQTQLDLQQTQITQLTETKQTQTAQLANTQQRLSFFKRYLQSRWATFLNRWIAIYEQREISQQLALDGTVQQLTEQEQANSTTTAELTDTQQQLAQTEQEIQSLQQQLQTQQQQLVVINQQISELQNNGGSIAVADKSYLFFNGQMLVMMENDALYYVHNDHLGTPQTITDEDQAIVWQAEYSPFGEMTLVIESVVNNVRFPGQYFDLESGFYYNYFRYYDPGLGRYITADPIGLGGGVNTYAYTEGNPINFTDSLGLKLGYIDPIFYNDILKIYSTEKGKELWDLILDDQLSINIFAGDVPGENCSVSIVKNNKVVGYNVYVYPRLENIQIRGRKDGGFQDFYASRIRKLAHELGHTRGALDDGPELSFRGFFFSYYATFVNLFPNRFNVIEEMQMNNINNWENPIMIPIEGIERIRYSGS